MVPINSPYPSEQPYSVPSLLNNMVAVLFVFKGVKNQVHQFGLQTKIKAGPPTTEWAGFPWSQDLDTLVLNPLPSPQSAKYFMREAMSREVMVFEHF